MRKEVNLTDEFVNVCVPVVSSTKETILNDIKEANKKDIQMIEWRADYYEDVNELTSVLSLLKEIDECNEKTLLFTYRTKAEGGQGNLKSTSEYLVLLKAVVLSKCIDIVDVELLLGDTLIDAVKKHAELCHVKVLVSNHDFDSTPRLDSIVARFEKMEKVGADIAKVAYFPKDEQDLMVLKQACDHVHPLSIPKIAIMMGELGKETRLYPNQLGSCVTFVTIGKQSAPGQVTLEEYNENK